MNFVPLSLVVLCVPDLERAVAFYRKLGLEFTKHAHGKGPEHYAAELPTVVFELYPQTPEAISTAGVRIGFRVNDVTAVLDQLIASGGNLVSPLKDSPWGKRAVIDDPFGHRIELSETTKP